MSEFTLLFPQDQSIQESGCYVVNASTLGLEYRKALVPLRHLDYHLKIVNSLLNVTLIQKYYNPTGKFLEVSYSLPISPESSIYRFQVEFNNVKIQGIVKEKEQAKKQYEEAKREGTQVVIGSIDSDSKDIMSIGIGNIPPETQFLITISFLQQMKISMNTFYRLLVPSAISPRFLNRIQNISKLPECMQQICEKSGKPNFTWSFKIQLKTTRKVVFFQSPSHKIKMISQNNQCTQTLLIMENQQIPNKDFHFLFTTQNFHLPSYAVGKSDTTSTVMLSFIPKFCSLSLNDAYIAEKQNKLYEVDMATAKGDYVFFLDRSGSMKGSRIEKAKQALIMFLKSLPEDSYFNVISFGSLSSRMFDTSQKYNAQKFRFAKDKIIQMKADMGGTQIYESLKQVLGEKVYNGYPKHIFILTDGAVSNTEGVIKMVERSTKYCRVHSIGIGNEASLNLIEGCAKAGKGKYIMIPDHENSSNKIIELLQSTSTPLITNLDLKIDYNQNIESIVPNPKSIPYILKNDQLNFYITFAKLPNNMINFSFQYEDSVTKQSYKSDISVDFQKSQNEQFVDKMSHLKVLRLLQRLSKDEEEIEDQMYYVKVHDYKQQAIQYSIKNQILSQYTAFICIGKELVDGQYQQYKDKGSILIQVKQPIPQQKLNIEQSSHQSLMHNLSRLQQLRKKRSYKCKHVEDVQAQDKVEKCLRQRTKVIEKNLIKQQEALPSSQKIQQIIDYQHINGSWTDHEYIESIAKNPQQMRELTKQLSVNIVITKLIVMWIQKYYPDKQYTLIVKKALSWLKTQIQENKFDVKLLQLIECI